MSLHSGALFPPLSLLLLLLFVYIVPSSLFSRCLTRCLSLLCTDHFSFLLSTPVSISQLRCRCPEKKENEQEKKEGEDLLHAETSGSVSEGVGRLGVLGGEGAEVFDVDGGHFDGDGFLFREKHCRNKKEEKS